MTSNNLIVAFETSQLMGAGRPEGKFLLNEPQATLLLTFMRNSDVVVEFKKRLVKAFYELKASAPKPMTQLDMIIAQAQMMQRTEQKLVEQDNRLTEVETKLIDFVEKTNLTVSG